MTKEFARILDYIELASGIIASFFLAYNLGKTVKVMTYLTDISYEIRDWQLTILIFLAVIFSILVLYILLYSQYEIINNQENIYKAISVSNKLDADENEWLCPKCGKKNLNYIGTCGCGYAK